MIYNKIILEQVLVYLSGKLNIEQRDALKRIQKECEDCGILWEANEIQDINDIHDSKSTHLPGTLHDLEQKQYILDKLSHHTIVISDSQSIIDQAREAQVATLAYETDEHLSADMIVQGFEEIDVDFLDKQVKRKRKLPWTVMETKRMLFREITIADVDRLYEIYAEDGITDYMEGLYEDPEEEREYTRAYIEGMYEFYGYGIWLLIEKETGRIIGRAGLAHQDLGEESVLEMGYVIEKSRQRMGYATEACEAIIRYAKEELDFPHLNCFVELGNLASVGLLKKLGFSYVDIKEISGIPMEHYRLLLA